MVNITLSADKDLVAKARAYAHARNTTLNQLIRDYLGQITGPLDREQIAAEFMDLALNHPGHPDAGFRFDHREIHRRGGDASR